MSRYNNPSQVMSPASSMHAEIDTPAALKLVPDRTDFNQWLESLMNELASKGLKHYILCDGFGENFDVQNQTKDKLLISEKMSKCFSVIWKSLDRSIQTRQSYKDLNAMNAEQVPKVLLEKLNEYKNSKAESSLLWAKLSKIPHNPTKLVQWLDEFQTNFSNYEQNSIKYLEIDQILTLWAQSECPEISDLARMVQDEKSKKTSSTNSIITMIKNQTARLSASSDLNSINKRKRDKSPKRDSFKTNGDSSKNNGRDKKKQRTRTYDSPCSICLKKFEKSIMDTALKSVIIIQKTKIVLLKVKRLSPTKKGL